MQATTIRNRKFRWDYFSPTGIVWMYHHVKHSAYNGPDQSTAAQT